MANSTSHDTYAEAADRQKGKVQELREEYARLRDEQLAALDKVASAETETEETRKRAAQSRRQEADTLEHHARVLSEIGAGQKEIEGLLRQSLALRVQAAQVEENAAEEGKAARRLELEIARQLSAEERKTATASQQRHVREWEAQERRIEGFGRLDNESRQVAANMGLMERHAQGAEAAVGGMTQSGPGLLALGARLGSIATGLQSVVAVAREGVQLADELAEEAYETQGVARNLQLDITGAVAAMDGLASEFEVGLIANKAYAMGVATTGDELASQIGMVRQQAIKLGKDQVQMVNDYVEAVGKQEAEIFDNLGLTLRLTDAYEIYAEELGVATDELNKSQKAEAFKKAAVIELERATASSTVEVQGAARAWKEFKVNVEDARKSAFGFHDTTGRVNEALRELSDEQLDRLRFGEVAAEGSAAAREAEGYLERWGLNLQDLRNTAAETGKSYQQMLADAKDAHAQEAAAAEDAAKEAQTLADINEKRALAADNDLMIELLEIEGLKEREKIEYQLESLRLRHEAAVIQAELTRSTKDEAKAKQLANKILVEEAKLASTNLGRGGKKGPSQADRVEAEAAARIKAMQDELQLLKLRSELNEEAAQVEYEIAERSHEIALAELDAERRALEVTRAKNGLERQQNAERLIAIERERDILDLEKRIADRAREQELIEQAVEETQKRLQVEQELTRQEQQRIAEVIQLEDYRYQAQEQAIRHRGAMATAAAHSDMARLNIQQTMEQELHANRMAQMRAEHAARLRELDARQAAAEALSSGTEAERLARQDELRQVAHSRDIERVEYEMQVRRAMEAEKVAMADREQKRQEAQLARLDSALSTFEQFRAQFTELGSFFAERSAAQADADLERTTSALKAKSAQQSEALEREIEAAEGNVQRQNELRRQQARQEAAMQRKIEEAERAHLEKRERQEMRAQGTQLMIVAAVEAVKAIAAFASFNYVEGALHVAAAAVAGIKGGMLLAGKVPGGSASTGSTSAGSAASMAANDQQYTDPSNVPGSVPGEAARRESATPQQAGSFGGGGTVININGGVHAMGGIDDEFTDNLARKLSERDYAREN